MTVEIWKDIPDLFGVYQISNLGRVRSYRLTGSKTRTVAEPKIVRPFVNKAGRASIDLGRGNKFLIARLVYAAFVGPIPDTMLVDHKDRNPSNDAVDNLRLATHQQNIRNRSKAVNNTTGYKGVYRHGAKFIAQITHDQKPKHIGIFDTPEDAARAYDAEAVCVYKDFASLNFVEVQHVDS